MFGDGSILDWALNFAFVAIMAGMAISLIRLARGPSMPDRVVALDLITVLAVAFCAVYAIASNEPAFLDVAIALALVAFLATVAFARFVERRTSDAEPSDETGEAP